MPMARFERERFMMVILDVKNALLEMSGGPMTPAGKEFMEVGLSSLMVRPCQAGEPDQLS